MPFLRMGVCAVGAGGLSSRFLGRAQPGPGMRFAWLRLSLGSVWVVGSLLGGGSASGKFRWEQSGRGVTSPPLCLGRSRSVPCEA